MNTIKSIDFLGNKPTLMINKNESHKSIFGGFMSIITILIFLLAIGYYLSKLFERQTFTVLKSDLMDLSQFVHINYTRFPIVIAIQPTPVELNETYAEISKSEKVLDMKVSTMYYKNTFDPILNKNISNVIYDSYALRKCESKDLELLKSDTDEINLNFDYFCLPKELNFTLKYPYAASDKFQGLFLNMKICDDENICYPKPIVTSLVQFVNFGIIIPGYLMDH
jgi:hypothetical protein